MFPSWRFQGRGWILQLRESFQTNPDPSRGLEEVSYLIIHETVRFVFIYNALITSFRQSLMMKCFSFFQKPSYHTFKDFLKILKTVIQVFLIFLKDGFCSPGVIFSPVQDLLLIFLFGHLFIYLLFTISIYQETHNIQLKHLTNFSKPTEGDMLHLKLLCGVTDAFFFGLKKSSRKSRVSKRWISISKKASSVRYLKFVIFFISSLKGTCRNKLWKVSCHV